MNTLVWAGLVVNALVHLRMAVLDVQDGEDRVRAGVNTSSEVICWQKGGYGKTAVIFRTIMAPLSTIFLAGKFLLFPRGIKSRFARQQEAEAKLDAEKKAHEEALRQVAEHEALVRAWAPGTLIDKPQPEQFALGWHAAADAFDAASELVARTKGQPWSPRPSTRSRQVKAMVGGTLHDDDLTVWDDE